MPTTQDYINEIRKRRELKQSVTIDFSAIPKEIDINSIKKELSFGLPEEYSTEIAKRSGKLTFDFAKLPIKEPSLFERVTEFAKEKVVPTLKEVFKEPAPSKYKTPSEAFADFPNLMKLNQTLNSFEKPKSIYDKNLAEMQLKYMAGKKPTDTLTDMEIATKWGSPLGSQIFAKNAPEISKEMKKMETYLTQGKPENLWDKIRDFIDPPGILIGRAKNIYNIHKQTGLPLKEIDDNYEQISTEFARQSGFLTQPTTQETMIASTLPLIAMGLATHPVATVGSLGSFMLLDYLVPTEMWMPTDPTPTERNVIELADFIGKGALIGGLGRVAKPYKDALITKFLKQKITEYNMPKTLRFSREQMREFFIGGQFSNAERDAIIKDLGLSHEQLRTAAEKGIEVEIPAEKIVTITDKPYWAKFKALWGGKPETQVIKEYADAVKNRDYRPYLEYKPVTEEVKPIEEIKPAAEEVKPQPEPIKPIPEIKPQPKEVKTEPVIEKTPIVEAPKPEAGIPKTEIETPKIKPIEEPSVRPEISPSIPLPEAMKPKIKIKSIIGDRKIITNKGEYSNGHWLLKPEYVPDKVREKFEDKEGVSKSDSDPVWKNIIGRENQKVSTPQGYVEVDDEIKYVLVTEDEKPVAVNKEYYDYLNKYIPEFRLEASKVNPKESPLVIYSGDKQVGLLMPYLYLQEEKDIKWLAPPPKEALTKQPSRDIISKEGEEYAEIQEIEGKRTETGVSTEGYGTGDTGVLQRVSTGNIPVSTEIRETERVYQEPGRQYPHGARPDLPTLTPEGIRPSASEHISATGGEERLPSPARGGVSEGARREIPTNFQGRRNYILTPQDAIGQGTPLEKFNNNINAIKTLKTILSEQRLATPEEQSILVKYIGWGAMPNVFKEWGLTGAELERHNLLKSLLTEEEWASARQSVSNAHFTSFEVINSIYLALKRLGFKGGRILEPSMGIGHFFGLMSPEILGNSSLTGIELEHLTGQIARQLYQNADIRIKGFQDVTLPDNYYDLVIGNVPFGDFKVFDPDYKKYNFLIHDYFLAKSIDKTRIGGINILITSHGTLDKLNTSLRRYLSERADLIGAIRLPKTAFKANAGTEVVCDILILQKRDPSVKPKDTSWIETGKKIISGKEYDINKYFIDHPEMVLGEHSATGSMYGEREYTVEPFKDIPLEVSFKEAIEKLPANIYIPVVSQTIKEPESFKDIPKNLRKGGITIQKGKFIQKVTEDTVTEVPVESKDTERMKAIIDLRDDFFQLIADERNPDISDANILKKINKFREHYDKFVDKFGVISSKENAIFEADPIYPVLKTFDKFNPVTKKYEKTDIFYRRIIQTGIKAGRAETSKEALFITLAEKNIVDIDRISELTGKDIDTIKAELAGLIFYDPEKGWITKEEYLSGDVKSKLAVAMSLAENDPSYLPNVEALKSVLPADIKPSEIGVTLGSPWIPPKYIKDFIDYLLKSGHPFAVKVFYNKYTSLWSIQKVSKYPFIDNVYNIKTWGLPELTAVDIIEKTLNGKVPVVKKRIHGEVIIDKEKTALAREKQQLIQEEFKKWIWDIKTPEDKERVDILSKIYNDKFNNLVPRKFNGEHLTSFPGMNPNITLTPAQKDSVFRILQSPNTLLALEVGGGKTFVMIAAGMEMRRLGIRKKILYTFPNHLLNQWESEFRRLYPVAKILAPTKQDFLPQNRKAFMGKIVTGDWDAILIPQSQFTMFPISKETVKEYYTQQIQELEDSIQAIMQERGKYSVSKIPPTVKQMESMKRKLEAKLSLLLSKVKEEEIGITFEETGIDQIFVDESQMYKNLFFVTKKERIAGLSARNSGRASDMYMKVRYIQKINNGGGVVFATGTPIANSIAEMFTLNRYLSPLQLQKEDMDYFDAWADTFGQVVQLLETNVTGTNIRLKSSFSKFNNVPEMWNRFLEYAEPRSKEQMGLDVPAIRGGKPEVIRLPKSADLENYIQELVKRVGRIEKGIDPSEDNMLKVTIDGMKASLDMRLIDSKYADNPDSKVNKVVENVYNIWKETEKDRLTQIIFCDLSVPRPGKFSVYQDIKDKLIKLGIPKEEIAFIHSYKKEELEEVFRKVREGEIRIFMASTQRGGTGMNIQDKLYAAHHLDVPWDPWMLEQRDGRIVRQGNTNKEVRVFRYVVEGSFDVYKLQIIERKVKGFGNLLYGKFKGRDFEDITGKALTAEEVKAIASGNPLIIEQIKLNHEVDRLETLKTAYINNRMETQGRIAENTSKIEFFKGLIPKLTADLEQVKLSPKEFNIEIEGKVYKKRGEAGVVINEIVNKLSMGESKEIGTYKGFILGVFRTELGAHIIFTKGQIRYEGYVSLDSPEGTFKSLDFNFSEKKIQERIENAQNTIKSLTEQNSQLAKEIDKPFDHEEELKQLSLKLDEINKKLGVDKEELGSIGGRGIEDEEEEIEVQEGKEDFEEEIEDERFEKSEGNKRIKNIANMAIEAAGDAENEFLKSLSDKFAKVIPEATTPPPEITEIIPTLDLIKPVECPELIEIAKNIMGKPPSLKLFRKALGKLYAEGETIDMAFDRRIFGDPDIVAKVIGHEIGHLTDYLEDYTLARGNLLGRIFSFKKYLNNTYGETEITNKVLKEELKALSKWWRPYDEKKVSKEYLSERNTAKELYADAISVLLNSPKHLESKAPNFWKLLFENLDKKPTILDELIKVWDLYNSGPSKLAKKRLEDFHKAFVRGEEIIKSRKQEKELANKRGWEWIRIFSDDYFYVVKKHVEELEAQGIVISEEENPKFMLNRLETIDNDVALALRQIDLEVTIPLLNAEISKETIGDYLILKRIILERKDIANPGGHNLKTAQDTLDEMRAMLGDEKWRILEDGITKFHEIVFRYTQLATEVGIYSKEVFEKVLVPNKDVYVTFAYLDHLDNYVPAGLHAQVGGLGDIANPYLATQMKLVSIIRLINLQTALNSVRDMLLKYFPEDIEKAESIKGPNGDIIGWRRSKNPKLSGRLEVLEDGKKVVYNVNPELSIGFDAVRGGMTNVKIAAKFLDLILLRKLFHAVFVEYNLGFMGWNILKDLIDNITLNPDVPITTIIASYIKSLPEARKRSLGEITPLIEEMLKVHAIGLEGQNFVTHEEDDVLTAYLRRYGIIPQKEEIMPVKGAKAILKPIIQVLSAIKHLGSTIESLGKISMYQVRKEMMIKQGELRPYELGYKVNVYSGTPDWLVKGLTTQVTNSIFMYSNVMIQGIKRMIDIASSTDPKIKKAFWWRLVIFSLPKIFMRLAAVGVAGKLLKDVYDRIPEYDKTHYVCVPIGIYPSGNYGWKTVYFRIPPGYTMQLPTSLIWKLSGYYAEKQPKQWQQILDLAGDQLPNVSPAIKIEQAWYQYLTGRTPYDTWLDRQIIPDHTAGTWPALKQMVYWTIDQTGLLKLAKYNEVENTTTEIVFKTTPLLSRFIKISDYGMVEKEKWFIELHNQDRANLKMARSSEERRFLSRLFFLRDLKSATESLPAEQREASFSNKQRQEYNRLSNFYYKVYLPIQKNITNQAEKGRQEEVTRLSEVIQQRVKNFLEREKTVKR